MAAELGITGTSQAPQNWGPPTLSFTNYAALTRWHQFADAQPDQRGGREPHLGPRRSQHDIRRRTTAGSRSTATATPTRAASSLSPAPAPALVTDGIAAPGTGFDFASFLLGTPDTSALRYGNSNLYFRTATYDVYMTDDWRFSQKFSINFGLRWDYGTPDHRTVRPYGQPGRGAGVRGHRAGSGGPIRTLLRRRFRDRWSSRTGTISLRVSASRGGLFPRRSMVVRGGYGTYYNSSVYNTIANNMAQQPPSRSRLSVANTLSNPLTLQNGLHRSPGQSRLHQHLRHRPELPHWLCADVADFRAAGPGAFAGRHGDLQRNQRHGPGPDAPAQLGAIRAQGPTDCRRATSTNSPTATRFTTAPHSNSCGASATACRRTPITPFQGNRQRGAGAELPGYLGRARALSAATARTC